MLVVVVGSVLYYYFTNQYVVYDIECVQIIIDNKILQNLVIDHIYIGQTQLFQ